METTRLSTKGQIILPKAIRDSHAWRPGTEFVVEETKESILIRPVRLFPARKLDDFCGSLKSRSGPKTIADMNSGIEREVRRRHDRGRY